MEFRILGPLEAIDEGRPVPLDRPLSRALLAYLLLHANEPVSSERLVDRLWGEQPPKTAVASLQNHVSRLRKSIGRERLRLEPAGYVLRVDPEGFDLARFDRLVAEAHKAPARKRAELLRAAISLWRGEPLEDLAFEGFAQAEIAQLSERLLSAMENRIDADLELGGGSELVDELEGLVAAHPLRERLRAQLMLALYRAGRQADALEAYREARRMLRGELGLEPSEELRSLERRILEHDPALFTSTPDQVRRESRRTVTILFCDVVDSTRLATTLDAEAYRRVMSTYYEAAKRVVEAHGGMVEKFIGDAVMAAFGVPERHEDDPLRAVRAAIDVRRAIESLEVEHPLQVRIAVNTGEVVTSVESDRPPMTGAAINIAARLEKRSGANEIVLGEKTHALAQDAVRAEPVDLGEGLHAYRLGGVIADARPGRRFDAPLVGRKRELRKLRAELQRAAKSESCGVVTVVGEAGIGKTRLVREFVASARDQARVVVGRCVSYGAGATYLPIAEVVRRVVAEPSAAGIASLLGGEKDAGQIAERLAEMVGFTEGPAVPGESFWAVRRLLEVLARERPLVVVFEDLHWAEQTLLDLIEYLGEWAEGAILVLCAARRELIESRPAWGGPTSAGFVVELEPLSGDDVAMLLDERAGGAVAVDIQQRIVERTGGNPLFAEQLLAFAAEAPEVSLDETPPTVEALIASRLDRLDARELDILRRASVIGRLFSRVELEELAPVEDVDLCSLGRRGLLHAMEAKDQFRFHHVLVREVAYRGIVKAERAELHERVATNLDRRNGADEIVGYHLEQAYRYRADLAPVGEEEAELAARAANRLAAAGRRASSRVDMIAADNLLSRAVSLLPDTSRARPELLTDLGEVLRETGDFERAATVLAEAIEAAGVFGDRAVEVHARLIRLRLRIQVDPAVRLEELIRMAEEAISLFEELGDQRRLAKAWFFLAWAPWVRGSVAQAEKALERAIEVARRAGDERTEAQSINLYLGASLFGPTPVAEAIRRCEQQLARPLQQRRVAAAAYRALAGLRAMQGRFDDARRMARQDRAILEDLGLKVWAAMAADTYGLVEILAGDADAAERELRAGYEALEEIGETSVLANLAAMLAQVLYSHWRDDEALRFSEISEQATARDDLTAQVQWRAVRAKLLARTGESEESERLAREAVVLAAETPDFLLLRGDALLDLADVLAATGQQAAAVPAIENAIQLYERKGNVVSASAARERLAEIDPPDGSPRNRNRKGFQTPPIHASAREYS
jgi:predicted ATPase/DNA-binding SARP family transcriptional activator